MNHCRMPCNAMNHHETLWNTAKGYPRFLSLPLRSRRETGFVDPSRSPITSAIVITVQRVVSGRRKKKRGSEASRDTLGSVKFVRFRAVAIRGNFLRKRTKARGPRGAGLRTDSVRLATDRRTGSQLPSSCGGSMKIEREFANAPRCPLRGFIGPGDPRGCRLYSLAFSHSIANACKCNTYGTWEDSKKISERG